MNRKILAGILALSIVVFAAFSLTGCNKQHDIIEEPDITVEYLSGEYADQLLRDGGECTLGTISTSKDGEVYTATINSMVIVESDSEDDGYYIADKNVSTTASLDSNTRITYIDDEDATPKIVTLEEFVTSNDSDSASGGQKLYDIYTMGDSVLMILAKELPDNE